MATYFLVRLYFSSLLLLVWFTQANHHHLMLVRSAGRVLNPSKDPIALGTRSSLVFLTRLVYRLEFSVCKYCRIVVSYEFMNSNWLLSTEAV